MALSLVERLAELTDPRGRNGRQYPMVGLLTLCLVAVLAGDTTPEAIAQSGRLRQRRLGHALGFKNVNMPCASAASGLLRKLDADHLDRIIGAWLADRHPDGWDHIALDGKRLCGSRDADVPGTHLLAAYAPRASAVIAQMTVDATTTNTRRRCACWACFRRWAGPWSPPMPCSPTPTCARRSIRRGGEYILYAKKNQSELRRDIEAAFSAADGGDFPPLRPVAVG